MINGTLNETMNATLNETIKQPITKIINTKACDLQFATQGVFGKVSNVICYIINFIIEKIIKGFFIDHSTIAAIILIILLILAVLWWKNRK